MNVDISLQASRERALDHITVRMESMFCAGNAAPRNSKMAKGPAVVVTEITELQSELEATEVDTSLSSDRPEIHEGKENCEMDERISADAGIAVEDGVAEEATSSESEAAECFMEGGKDLQEVEGKDATTETLEIVDKVENAQHDEVVKDLGTIWIAPGKTAWLAAWLEEAAYWEGRGGLSELEMISLRRLKRFNTI